MSEINYLCEMKIQRCDYVMDMNPTQEEELNHRENPCGTLGLSQLLFGNHMPWEYIENM